MKRVVVVGAGVIGLSIAKELAARGIETEVYDGKKSVVDEANKASGILSKRGLELSGLNFKDAVVNMLRGATLHFKDEAMRVHSDEVKAYILDRSRLAQNCYNDALDAGAAVHLGKRLSIDGIRELDDGKTIIVGADGAVSNVARAFKFPGIGSFVLTYKAEYEHAKIPERDMVDLFFSKKFAHGFFAWSAPYSYEVVELGVGVESSRKMHSIAAFEEFLKVKQVKAMIGGARRVSGGASIIPIGDRPRTVIGNVLLVGDAAGQTKATTGGGIIFGVACAKVAARDIEAAIKNGKLLASYEKDWRRTYGMDLKMHRALHNYYSWLSDNNMERFARIAKILGAENFFSKYGDMDSPTLMLKRLLIRKMAK